MGVLRATPHVPHTCTHMDTPIVYNRRSHTRDLSVLVLQRPDLQVRGLGACLIFNPQAKFSAELFSFILSSQGFD